MKNIWKKDPVPHDYPAAVDYLELLMSEKDADELVQGLEKQKTVFKKAKDILRASGLQLLPKTNLHVAQNLKKVKRGEKLSPVLLVRDDKLIIADGYHRVCAIYYLSEDLTIPCRIV
jgi:disulfide oxidoreductase YuzD